MGEYTQSFVCDVAPVVRQLSAWHRLTEDQEADALSLAWWFWSRRDEDYHPRWYARYAVRQVRCGRVLPGTGLSRKDVYARMRRHSGGGMGGLRDPRPGPAEEAGSRESYEEWEASLTARDIHLIEMILDGIPGGEIARRMGVTPAAITRRRQRIASRAG